MSNVLLDRVYTFKTRSIGWTTTPCPLCFPFYGETSRLGYRIWDTENVTTLKVFCLTCGRKREWKQALWDDSYIERAIQDFITLVTLEGDHGDSRTTDEIEGSI